MSSAHVSCLRVQDSFPSNLRSWGSTLEPLDQVRREDIRDLAQNTHQQVVISYLAVCLLQLAPCPSLSLFSSSKQSVDAVSFAASAVRSHNQVSGCRKGV